MRQNSFSHSGSWGDAYAYGKGQRILGELSDRAYNLVLGGTLAWGFLVNAVICLFFTREVLLIPAPLLLIGYLVCAIVGVMMSARSKNPAVSFVGYNLVVLPLGAVLTVLVSAYDPNVVRSTFVITAIVVTIMTLLSSAFPRAFLSLGPTLGITLVLTLLASLVMGLLGFSPAWLDVGIALLFSGYVGFDFARAQTKLKTLDSAIDSAAELYVDIVNLFIRLLAIVDRSSRRR